MRATIHGLRIAVIALGCYWVLMFISTHVPASALPRVAVSDKIIHAVAFAGLAFLLAWAIPTNLGRPLRNVFLAGLIGTLYASLDELLQIPVGRTADWQDFWADCVGILFGLLFYTSIRYHLNRLQISLFGRAAG
ncbi:MAG: VanZ family protein [Pirellula staleyi]